MSNRSKSATRRLSAVRHALIALALTSVSVPVRADTPLMPDCPPLDAATDAAAAMPMPMPDMKMNDPMPIPMAKEGMTKGDVTMMAAQRKACMDKMLEQEQLKVAPVSAN